jgi:predicted HAD superfamily phosphohydrolase YqeG
MNLKNYIKYWFKGNKKEIITEEYNSIFDIPFEKFKEKKLFIFDVDDTITPHKDTLDKKVINLFTNLINKNFTIALLSNCNKSRGDYLLKELKKLNITIEVQANKPAKEPYLRIIKKLNLKPADCIVIGERVATDLYGGYLSDISYRILVKPYSKVFGGKKADFIYKTVRSIENWFARNT